MDDGEEHHDGGAEEEEEDDTANADLSLGILRKAKQMRSRNSVVSMSGDEYVEGTRSDQEQDGPGNVPVSEEGLTVLSFGLGIKQPWPKSNSSTPEEGELQEDGQGNLVLAGAIVEAAEVITEMRKKKKKKKKKEKKCANINARIGSNAVNEDVEIVDAEESIVMRKLLRGPRYFDPPGEQDQSCYNCGQPGHLAVDCPEEPRPKPCFVCGNFGHDGWECPQKTDCYVCRKVGHIAKDCPNKGMRSTTSRDAETICLMCGRAGHDMRSCCYDYDRQDLEQVQCYICKRFGHLSCVEIFDTSPTSVSCFSCGDVGHVGSGCARMRKSNRDGDKDRERTAQYCYKCGEEGHFARGCSKGDKPRQAWPAPWPGDNQKQLENDSPVHTYLGKDCNPSPTPLGLHQRWMNLHQDSRWTPSPVESSIEQRWNSSRTGQNKSHGRYYEGAWSRGDYSGREGNNFRDRRKAYNEDTGTQKDGQASFLRKRSWGSSVGGRP